MMTVLRAAIDRRMPVLGVCLGLQAIGEVLGATVTHAPRQMHGKTSRIEHDGNGLFAGLPIAAHGDALPLALPGSGDDSRRAARQRAQRRRRRSGHRASRASGAWRTVPSRIGA